MLVLTRRVGQGIQIGDNIKVTITRIRDGQVHIGIDAPKEVKIMREEIITRYVDEGDEEGQVYFGL